MLGGREGEGRGAQEVQLQPRLSDPLPSGKLSPVRLSGISRVLPYDELSASYVDSKLSKDGRREKKKEKKSRSARAAHYSLLD